MDAWDGGVERRTRAWSEWARNPPRVFAVGDSDPLRRLAEACWAAGIPIATSADEAVSFRTTGVGTLVPGGVHIVDRLVGERIYGWSVPTADPAAALMSRTDWIVVDERPQRPSGGAGAAESWRLLRPWIMGRDAYCLQDTPVFKPSRWVLWNWIVIHLVPGFVQFRTALGDVAPQVLSRLPSVEMRLQRLLQIRERIEHAYFVGEEAYHDEIDLMVDAALVFGTAALDTLAVLLLEASGVQVAAQNRSLRLIRQGGRPVHAEVWRTFAGRPVDTTDSEFDGLHRALEFLYKVRNQAGHVRAGETHRYRVSRGRIGQRDAFYDDPQRPASRRRVQATFGGTWRAGMPLLPVELAGGLGVAHVEAWNECAGGLGVYTDRVGGVDAAFIDPLLLSEQIVAFVSRWMIDAMAGLARILEAGGAWRNEPPLGLSGIEVQLDHFSRVTWRVAAGFSLEAPSPCGTPLQ